MEGKRSWKRETFGMEINSIFTAKFCATVSLKRLWCINFKHSLCSCRCKWFAHTAVATLFPSQLRFVLLAWNLIFFSFISVIDDLRANSVSVKIVRLESIAMLIELWLRGREKRDRLNVIAEKNLFLAAKRRKGRFNSSHDLLVISK